jgi:hypothetical protein
MLGLTDVAKAVSRSWAESESLESLLRTIRPPRSYISGSFSKKPTEHGSRMLEGRDFRARLAIKLENSAIPVKVR